MPARARFAVWVFVVAVTVAAGLARTVWFVGGEQTPAVFAALVMLAGLVAMVGLLVTTPAGAIKLPTWVSFWAVLAGTLVMSVPGWATLTALANAPWSVAESWRRGGVIDVLVFHAWPVATLGLLWALIVVIAWPTPIRARTTPSRGAARSPWWAVPILWFPFELAFVLPDWLGVPIDRDRVQVGAVTSMLIVVFLAIWHMRAAPVEAADVPGVGLRRGAFGAVHSARADFVLWWGVVVLSAAFPTVVGVRF